MEPAHATIEDGVPVKVAGFQLRRRFVAAVVKDHRCADALAAVAEDCGDIRSGNAIVLEALVEGLDAHRPHPLGHHVAERIVYHGGDDAGLQTEAIRQVGSDVKLSATDMELACGCLAERNDPRVYAVDKGAERYEIKRAPLTDL